MKSFFLSISIITYSVLSMFFDIITYDFESAEFQFNNKIDKVYVVPTYHLEACAPYPNDDEECGAICVIGSREACCGPSDCTPMDQGLKDEISNIMGLGQPLSQLEWLQVTPDDFSDYPEAEQAIRDGLGLEQGCLN